MSAHSASQRRGWLSAIVAQVTDFMLESAEETIEAPPAPLQPRPVLAVVSAAPRSGATTVARLLAAELAARADGAAIVTSPGGVRRTAPPSRAAIRLATALTGAAHAHPCGRLCIVQVRRESAGPSAADEWGADAPASNQPDGTRLHVSDLSAPTPAAADTSAAAGGFPAGAAELRGVVTAARYLAPVVLDLPPDGSAAEIAELADRAAVVVAATAEPALLDAVAAAISGDPVKVVNRLTDPSRWSNRADIHLPDSRIAARAAAMGTRPLGPLGSGISALADSLEPPR